MTFTRKTLIVLLALIVVSQAAACGGGAEEAEAQATLEALHAQQTAQVAEAEAAEPAAEPEEPSEPEPEEPEFLIMPGVLPPSQRTLEDSNSSIRSYEHRAVSGDNFLNGLYERPFTSQEMIYQPDLDIITVDFADGIDFFYFTIRLYGMNPDEWGLNGIYGVEFDRTLTGRGDLIVVVEKPTEEWSVENVVAFADSNADVGGPQPMIADAGGAGDGYDMRLDMGADFVAYARIDPEDPEAVQIAVSKAMLDNPTTFLWGAWADNGLKNAAMYDYNDSMGPSAAGSPIKGDADYPLKELFNLDSTCRLPYGFAQAGAAYPGMCINVAPAMPGCVCVRYEFLPDQQVKVCVSWDCP
jgi:hypothetical protein